MKCIIHYPNIKFAETSKLIDVDEVRFQELVAAKQARLTLSNKDLHYEQCYGVPEEYTDGLFYHRECYANFTRARADLSKINVLHEVNPIASSSLSANTESQRPQRSSETDHVGRFPDYCWFCKEKKAKRIRSHNRNIFEPVTVVKKPLVEKTLKNAAEKRKDHTLLRCIDGVELCKKKFKKHDSCYKEYTRACYIKETTPNENQDKSGYEVVKEVILNTVIAKGMCVSLDEILECKGEQNKNNQTRRVVKAWIERNFKDDIVFLTTHSNEAQVIVSSEVWDEVSSGMKPLNSSITSNDKSVLKDAATILQKMIFEYTDNAEPLPWPPTVQSLRDRLKSTPELLLEFLRLLLSPKDAHHATAESTNRLVESFAQDLVFSITKGSFLTLKHTSVGLGLHSMTGLKIPIVILSHLGHSITYDTTMEIETAEAEISQQFDTKRMSLPIQPKDPSSSVPTIFWFDNFDSFVDNNTGAGSIHNTPGVAFQEQTTSTIKRPDECIPKSKKRSLSEEEQGPITKNPKINPKQNPQPIGSARNETTSLNINKNRLLSTWKAARYHFRNDQRFSRFAGLVIECFKRKDEVQTVLTYLPPIERPITNYGTLFEVLHRAERLAEEANMTYTHIIMDCGAAMKMNHVIWNNPERYSKVIIHLGDFHFMQAYFDVIGRYVSRSGFEDIVYQLGLCQPGSMNALIKGKHYNQAWLIHESFAEAITRIFFDIYLPKMPTKLLDAEPENLHDVLLDAEVIKFLNEYDDKITKGLKGELGITAQYWLRYVELVDRQQNLHQSIQTNNFDERLSSWRVMLPAFFFFDKTHYSRYGTQYVEELANIEFKYPGAREEMMEIGISVRRNTYGIGQAVDLAGEQTFMRNAKTVGGIKSFQTRRSTVLKWVRNRAHQTQFVESLKEIAGIEKTSQNLKKCLRPTEILKSNLIVERLVKTMKEQFTHPFHPAFEKQHLYNLVSGCPVSDNIAESLSSIADKGFKYYIQFKSRLIGGNNKSFFDPITRNKQATFSDTVLKIALSKKGKIENVQVERNILGVLLAESSKNGQVVDINSALCYPLNPVPPSLCTADGGRRKTTKSDLLSVMGDMTVEDIDEVRGESNVYMEDLAAFVRSTVSQCRTIRDLAVLLLQNKPRNCKRFYVMVDSYENDEIKASERKMRGDGVRYILKNLEMKIPHDINSFLAVGENKDELFKLIRRGIAEQSLDDITVLFCSKDSCVEIVNKTSIERPGLASQYLEADFMFTAYSTLEEEVLIRSRSGDIDIIVSLVGHPDHLPTTLYVDNGTGDSRKLLQISLCELTEEQRRAVIGLHAFTGNDYVSSFFRKGKKTCWKIAKRNPEFIRFFANLGNTNEITDEQLAAAEAYVCALYGKPKLKGVNLARSTIFWQKYNKSKKVIELSLLPPCQSNLIFHLKRSNYIARIMRHAHVLKPNLDSYTEHGWTEDGETTWSKEYLPENIKDVLYDDAAQDDEGDDDDVEDELFDDILDESNIVGDDDDDLDIELDDFS